MTGPDDLYDFQITPRALVAGLRAILGKARTEKLLAVMTEINERME
jgi:hypothetical protein